MTVHYVKSGENFYHFVAEFFSAWEVFYIEVIEKIETHILFPQLCRLWDV